MDGKKIQEYNQTAQNMNPIGKSYKQKEEEKRYIKSENFCGFCSSSI